jgi:hypothetical protein
MPAGPAYGPFVSATGLSWALARGAVIGAVVLVRVVPLP